MDPVNAPENPPEEVHFEGTLQIVVEVADLPVGDRFDTAETKVISNEDSKLLEKDVKEFIHELFEELSEKLEGMVKYKFELQLYDILELNYHIVMNNNTDPMTKWVGSYRHFKTPSKVYFIMV